MITLDEAIKHCEEKEEHHRRELAEWEATSGTNHYEDELIGRCIKNNRQCAEEHRQLAKWLKDYKRLLKKESGADIRCGNCKYDGVSSLEICGTCFHYSNWEEV